MVGIEPAGGKFYSSSVGMDGLDLTCRSLMLMLAGRVSG